MNKRYPRYPDDADYQTNAPSYYEDLARKQKLIEMLAKKIWEYDEELAKRFEAWDKNLEEFPEEVKRLLIEWMEDGTLDHIINDTIFNWKADKTYVDDEIERLDQKDEDITLHLSQTESDLMSRGLNIMNPPIPLVPVKINEPDSTSKIQVLIDNIQSNRDTYGNKARLIIPTGTFNVTNLTLPNNIEVHGMGRDNTRLVQIKGSTGAVITDKFETGAFSIRLHDFRIDCQNNINSTGIELGFNTPDVGEPSSHKVWGVEGRIESVMVRNATNYGFKVKSSVTTMDDVIALFCDIGFYFNGGSCSVGTINGDSCREFIQFRGSSNKIDNAHYEGGSDSVVKFLTGSQQNVIKHISVLTASTPYKDLFTIETGTSFNGLENINVQNFKTGVFDNIIVDNVNGFTTDKNITTYMQAVRKPVKTITDNDLNQYKLYSINHQTGGLIYVYKGTETSVTINLPKYSDYVGTEIRVINTTDKVVSVQDVTGELVMYGEKSIDLPTNAGYTFISDGTGWVY